jgi:hypothetical protein
MLHGSVNMPSLEGLVKPPLIPEEVPTSDQELEVRRAVGDIPTDYLRFLGTYGTGCIDEFIWIFSPSSRNENLNFLKQLELQTRALVGGAEFGAKPPPFPVYPMTNGFVPFGITDNGDLLG